MNTKSSAIAEGLEAPYYIAQFATQPGPSQDRDADAIGRMIRLAVRAEGFLGLETVNRDDGTAAMQSYWSNLETLDRWKLACDRMLAESCDIKSWYHTFDLKVTRIERHPLFKWIRRAA
ncbi:MAG: hypothetical protein FJX42_07695 [Alphaproteobacteria bacterium]|nr:hypothetical protein [Alphaproteobacteria bacterium]